MSIAADCPVAASSAGRLRRGVPSGILKPALILLAVIVAYRPAIDGAFLWDDHDNITNNKPLRSLDGMRRIWFEPGATQQYYPVLHTLFWVEYRLFGEDPRGYHLVNLLFHAAGASLLACVLVRLGAPGAWLAGAMFALHPVCAESVAWITEGKNTLSFCFFAASILAYLRAERIGEPAAAGDAADGDEAAGGELAGVAAPSGRRGAYALSLVLFAAAVLSKTNAVTLPAFVLVLLAWQRGRLTWRDFAGVAPMLVFGAAVAGVVVYVEKVHLGTSRAEFDWPWTERLLVAGRALWFYLGKLAWPDPLVFVYPRWQINAADPWQWGYLAAALALPLVLWKLRHRLGGGPLVAALYFGGTLIPQLGLLPLYGQLFSYVADHWVYLSAPGPIALAAAAMTVAFRKLAAKATVDSSTPFPSATTARLGAVGGLVVAASLGLLTHRQAEVYRSEDVLWSDTLAKNPDCWLAHHNRAVLRMGEQNYAEARAGLQASIALRPNFQDAYNNLGFVAAKFGEVDEARRAYERALEIDPRYAAAHANLATLLIDQGDDAGAIEHLEAAVARKPDIPAAMASLGLVLVRSGRTAEGIRTLETAIARDSADVPALVNLATVRAREGKLDEARRLFERAVETNPGSAEAFAGLGSVLVAQGKGADAVEVLAQAVRLDPQRVSVQFTLANTLVRLRRYGEAEMVYRQTIHAVPEHIPSHLNLAATLMQVGRGPEAEPHLDTVLRLQPNERNFWRNCESLVRCRDELTGRTIRRRARDRNAKNCGARVCGDRVASCGRARQTAPWSAADVTRRGHVGRGGGRLGMDLGHGVKRRRIRARAANAAVRARSVGALHPGRKHLPVPGDDSRIPRRGGRNHPADRLGRL
jgi:protein O-mannosyl-transferase